MTENEHHMVTERTLSIIKPDGVEKGVIGKVIARFEEKGLKPVAIRMVLVLEGEGAVLKNRDVMGATDPAKAAPGTLRKDFATDIEKNTVHGSDSPENAKTEIAYFFPETAICGYEWRK